MSFFDLFKKPDINKELEAFRDADGALLIDVRDPSEYAEGHIEGSINIPIKDIVSAKERIKDLNAPIFVYCLSGARSGRAASILRTMGYADTKSIGGINNYSGKLVK